MPGKSLVDVTRTFHNNRSELSHIVLLLLMLSASASAIAQDDLEEIVVVGSQIQGATVTDILPVTVISSEDIEALGIESGDELLENLPEMGQNMFHESAETGGLNSSRGDVGAYNLRNLGVGNTLVLLNGRRLVNSPSFQTEIIGGGYTPVSTVNSNLIPANLLERVEVLRDGASALYGADALAGVVNNVTDTNFEGLTVRSRTRNYGNYSNTDSETTNTIDQQFSVEFGTSLNEDKSHVTLNYSFLDKGHMRANSNNRWAAGDLSSFVPEASEYRQSSFWSTQGDAFFDQTSSNGALGRFDLVASANIMDDFMNATDPVTGLALYSNPADPRGYVDSGGEFVVYRDSDPRCLESENGVTTPYNTGYGTCIVSESGHPVPRYSTSETRWIRGDSERHNLFATFSHEIDKNVRLYNEFGLYQSSYYAERSGSGQFPYKFRVSGASYYNPMRQQPHLLAPAHPGAEMWVDNLRFLDRSGKVRSASVDKTTWRFLQGVEGSNGKWSYDGAFLISKAKSEDTQLNSVSRRLMQEALFDTTAAGYNFLCDPTNPDSACTTNLDRTLVSVGKKQISELTLFDIKMSTDELFEISSVPVAFLVGAEVRHESLEEDRDDLLSGSDSFEHLIWIGTSEISQSSCFLSDRTTGEMLATPDPRCSTPAETYPFITGIAGGTGGADFNAERDTMSLFTEFSASVTDNLDAQLAFRFEDTSDYGSELVWKFAFGWQLNDSVLVRGSAQTSFRAPDLVTLTQSYTHRLNSSQQDYTRALIEDVDNRLDDWLYRRVINNPNLKSETAQNLSFGLVLQPLDELTITLDAFQIVKENTIGNLGQTNEGTLDFLLRSQDAESRGFAALTNDTFEATCGTASIRDTNLEPGLITTTSTQHNTRVVRPATTSEDRGGDWDTTQTSKENGFCPVGRNDWFFAQSIYDNFGDRTIEGFDLGVYYTWENDIGSFDLRYNGAFTTRLEQEAVPGSDADKILQAQQSGYFDGIIDRLTVGNDEVTDLTINVRGFGDILGTNSLFEEKHSMRLSWRKEDWSASLTARHVGETTQPTTTLPDGLVWVIESMTTLNANVAYRFDVGDARAKVTFGANNVLDERAPLAVATYGYNPALHNDYGRSFYVDIKASF